MRFFKYLIFIFLSIFSVNVFAETIYACDASAECKKRGGPSAYVYRKNGGEQPAIFGCVGGTAPSGLNIVNQCPAPVECYFPDYKIVVQPINSLKKTICLPVAGELCRYTGNPTGSPIVNGSITTTFSSVSKTPDPSCKEELVNPPCDPKDPYGGCYTPPEDGCTRQFNGSIVCPPDVEPKVQNGCANGATYCDRPPQGCGQGYVSGSFNGKQICIKTSPSTGNPPNDGNSGDTGNTGEGTGTSTTTGTETTTTTTTNSNGSTSTSTSTTTNNNTTVNNFKIDLSGVIAAVNAVSAQVSSLKNELLTSISNLSSKLDSTNSKLDSTNSKLTDLNSSSLKQEQLLKDIRDKTNSDNGNPTSSTDLTGVHTRLDAIKEGINKKNEFDKEYSEWMKDPDFKDDSNPAFSGDSKVEIQESSAAPDLKDNYVSASAQCPPPLQISFNLLRTHTLTFSYDTMCLGASFARPFVIFSGMLIAFLIVTGSYRGSSDA